MGKSEITAGTRCHALEIGDPVDLTLDADDCWVAAPCEPAEADAYVWSRPVKILPGGVWWIVELREAADDA